MLPTAEYVRAALDYDPKTGTFRWKTRPPMGSRWNCRYAGEVAGSPRACGYRGISIDGQRHYEHRLAWLVMTGSWPSGEIDHRDCCRSNNRFANLREATTTENRRNARTREATKSGFKGVYWHGQRQRWAAQISDGTRRRSLGLFNTPEAAHAAYCDAARRFHGEFARFA